MLPKQSKIDLRYFTPMAHPALTRMETLRDAGALKREATHTERKLWHKEWAANRQCEVPTTSSAWPVHRRCLREEHKLVIELSGSQHAGAVKLSVILVAVDGAAE
jgi:very-short-patch-repair endonuclease